MYVNFFFLTHWTEQIIFALTKASEGHPDTLIKKENKYFLIYKEIEMESVEKSYIRKGFLIYEEIR